MTTESNTITAAYIFNPTKEVIERVREDKGLRVSLLENRGKYSSTGKEAYITVEGVIPHANADSLLSTGDYVLKGNGSSARMYKVIHNRGLQEESKTIEQILMGRLDGAEPTGQKPKSIFNFFGF